MADSRAEDEVSVDDLFGDEEEERPLSGPVRHSRRRMSQPPYSRDDDGRLKCLGDLV